MRTEVRPGSMGQPLPGFSCAVLHDDRDEPTAAGTPGRIAVDMTASPLAHFTGYHGDPDTTGRPAAAPSRVHLVNSRPRKPGKVLRRV